MDATAESRLDVIVRFHDAKRTFELERCLLSLVGQRYRPIHVQIVSQRFTTAQFKILTGIVEEYANIGSEVSMRATNFTRAQPDDARAALLNCGIAESEGRYLAFLDYDDVIQHTGYCNLVETLRKTVAAIAFGGVAAKYVTVEEDFLLVRKRKALFRPHFGLIDQFAENHCPINSFVIDRDSMAPEDLHFNETISKNEDYEFLLRTCAKYVSDFSQKKLITADYYIKDDCSNTILSASENGKKAKRLWKIADDFIETRRRQIKVSLPVQALLDRATDTVVPTIADYSRFHEPEQPKIAPKRAKKPH